MEGHLEIESRKSNKKEEDTLVKKKKKKALRSLTRILGEKNLLNSPFSDKLSRSSSDLSHLLEVKHKAIYANLTHS